MPLARPTKRFARELQDRSPADRCCRPTESLGHPAMHRDDIRRLNDARRRLVGKQRRDLPLCARMVEEQGPGRRRGSPDIWIGALVDARVPAAREGRLGVTRGLEHDAHACASSVHRRSGVVVLAGDVREERGLLLRRGDVQDLTGSVAECEHRGHHDRECERHRERSIVADRPHPHFFIPFLRRGVYAHAVAERHRSGAV
jgi:hypothetical protein